MVLPLVPHPDPNNEQSAKTILVGPVACGKTSLLASLIAATDQVHACDLEAFYQFYPSNDAMRRLDENCRWDLLKGRIAIDATQNVTLYDVELQEHREEEPGFFKTTPATENTYQFRLIDGPGGAIFLRGATISEELRKSVVEYARQAEGLILCIDATNEKNMEEFFVSLPRFFTELGARPKFKRIAIALTKADKHFMKNGCEAMNSVREANPWLHVRKCLSVAAFNSLTKYGVKNVERASCWVSAYGFVPRDGSANFDPHHDRMLTYRDNHQQHLELWRPFQVFAPFVYAATGNLGPMTPFE